MGHRLLFLCLLTHLLSLTHAYWLADSCQTQYPEVGEALDWAFKSVHFTAHQLDRPVTPSVVNIFQSMFGDIERLPEIRSRFHNLTTISRRTSNPHLDFLHIYCVHTDRLSLIEPLKPNTYGPKHILAHPTEPYWYDSRSDISTFSSGKLKTDPICDSQTLAVSYGGYSQKYGAIIDVIQVCQGTIDRGMSMLKTIAGSHPKGGFERVQPEWTWVGRGEKEQWKEEREIYEWETRWKRMAKERGREKAKEKEKKGRKGEVVSPLTCLTKRPGNILLHELFHTSFGGNAVDAMSGDMEFSGWEEAKELAKKDPEVAVNNADSLAIFAMAVMYSEWLCYTITGKGELLDQGPPYASAKRRERDMSWMAITDGITGATLAPARKLAKRILHSIPSRYRRT